MNDQTPSGEHTRLACSDRRPADHSEHRTHFAQANCLKRIAEARVNILTASSHAENLAPDDLAYLRARLETAERELKLALAYLSNPDSL